MLDRHPDEKGVQILDIIIHTQLVWLVFLYFGFNIYTWIHLFLQWDK